MPKAPRARAVPRAASDELWGVHITEARAAAIRGELDAASAGLSGKDRRAARLSATRVIREREEAAARGNVSTLLAKKVVGGGSRELFDALDEVSDILIADAAKVRAAPQKGAGDDLFAAQQLFSAAARTRDNPLASIARSAAARGLTTT
jgi:hypothetical protein